MSTVTKRAKLAAFELQKPSESLPEEPLWIVRWQIELANQRGKFAYAVELLDFFDLQHAEYKVVDGKLLIKPSTLALKYVPIITLLKPYLIEILSDKNGTELRKKLRNAFKRS